MSKTAYLKIESLIGPKDGFAEMWGDAPNFSAADMSAFLSDNANAKTIEIDIRTDGGNVDEALDIRDQLAVFKSKGGKVITNGYRVNSAGTVIFLAGDERLVSDNVQFIIHNARISYLQGALTADALEEVAKEIRVYDEKLLNEYTTTLNLDDATKAEVKDLMDKETDLGVDLALKYGFATGKLVGISVDNKAGKNIFYTNKIAALITNKKNNTEDMSKVLNAINALSNLITKSTKKAETTEDTPEVTADSTMLEDGVTPIYHDGELIVGSKVYTDEKMTLPASEGDHVLEDKRTITVIGTEGEVTAIIDAPAAAADDKDKEIENLKKQLADKEKADKATEAKVVELTKNVEALLKKVPGSNDPNEVGEGGKKSVSNSIAATMAKIAKEKNQK